MRSIYIRQRLLESCDLDLKATLELAQSLELAEEQSKAYQSPYNPSTVVATASKTLCIK